MGEEVPEETVAGEEAKETVAVEEAKETKAEQNGTELTELENKIIYQVEVSKSQHLNPCFTFFSLSLKPCLSSLWSNL
jgi:hypothetical protein